MTPREPAARWWCRSASRRVPVLWTGAAGFAASVGVMSTAGLIGWLNMCWLFMAMTMFGWMWAALWLVGERHPPREVIAAGPASAILFLVAVGLLDGLGPVAFPVMAALVLTQREVYRALRDKVRRSASEPMPGAQESEPVADASKPTPVEARQPIATFAALGPIQDEPGFVVPDTVSVADLCQAWCSSYLALQRARTVGSRLNTVKVRALYLDELERRLGRSVSRWIDSGPRAAEDPGRFLGVGVTDTSGPSRS